MKKLFLPVAAAALLVSGCAGGGRPFTATTYGPMHLFGGYTDKEIEPGLWKVTGAGNGPAGEGFGRNVAVYRAAEIVKAHGFTHLQILDQKGKVHMMGRRGSSMSFAGETMALTVRGTNDPAAPLACRAKSPDACMTLAVETVMATIGPRLSFRKNEGPNRAQ
jgi:hypothetical protein